MHASSPGLFALVSYVPDPLGPFLDGLRQSLPGVEFPQSHITILPPRPLRVSVEIATRYAQQVLQEFQPFAVELTAVHRFPETNVLYLDLEEGNAILHELHDALNTAALEFGEQFEFRPHVTLGGPIPDSSVNVAHARAEHAWRSADLAKRFAVQEVVALWGEPGHPSKPMEWQRLWSYELTANQHDAHAAAGVSHRTF